jgi:Xaa-Pro aminopeptidase
MNGPDIRERLERLTPILEKKEVQALLVMVTEGYNWESACYISGFRGSSCSLIITGETNILITDGRYITQAREQTPFSIVDQAGRSMFAAVKDEMEKLKLKRVGYEADKLSVAQFNVLQENSCQWRDLSGVIPELRRTKDSYEISLIREAARIAQEAYESTLVQFQEGSTESEFANLLEFNMKKIGAEGGWPGHGFIVASGLRSAMPHGAPTSKKVQEGDWVTVDFGASYNGYVSDITRNFVIGRISPEGEKIHHVLYEAHVRAAESLRPGISGRDVDAIARKVIEGAGYADHFTHGLGHSFGLEVHESPRLSSKSTDILQTGDVVTIEPGIYIEGLGGMRLEDDYLITEEGYECLTSGPDRDIRVLDR